MFLRFLLKETRAPFLSFNPFQKYDLLLSGGVSVAPRHIIWILIFCFFLAFISWKRLQSRLAGMVFIILLLFTSFYVSWIKAQRWHKQFHKYAVNYMQAQLWARNHTAPDALFFIDPAFLWSWRDFSLRSSFGSIAEWGYNCLAYINDYKAFKEGRERLKLFGVDLSKIDKNNAFMKDRQLANLVYHTVRENLYLSTEEHLKKIVNRYQIDYIVLYKPSLIYYKNPVFFKWTTVYQNDVFIIFSTLQRSDNHG